MHLYRSLSESQLYPPIFYLMYACGYFSVTIALPLSGVLIHYLPYQLERQTDLVIVDVDRDKVRTSTQLPSLPEAKKLYVLQDTFRKPTSTCVTHLSSSDSITYLSREALQVPHKALYDRSIADENPFHTTEERYGACSASLMPWCRWG